ncbi:MAG: hypothetical protein ACK41W_00075 [Cyanobacteriota bacterium]|jgi:hypothetical protein
MPEPPITIRTSSGDHPGSKWLSRFLLFPALAIVLALTIRVIYSEANFFGEKHRNRGVLVDNIVVNLAATSSLFVLSAVVLQGAIKKAARDEMATIAKKLLVEDLAPSIRVQLLTPLTGDSSKETSLIAVRSFLSVSGLFIQHLRAAKKMILFVYLILGYHN